MDILINKISEYDYENILKFVKSNAKDAFPNDKAPISFLKLVDSNVHNCIINGKCLKATNNKEILGAVISPAPEGGVSTIIWLLVDRRFRGIGIGVQLINYFISMQKYSGIHKIKLTVATRQAMSFYKKKGFIVEGYHQNHWFKIDYWSMAYQID